ncbi:MAG: 4-hydroxythreonine-4-phosphate dehydrogenase PdxA [Puniceicoccaceae bacterium]|nr:MAG: 4-hydroxythreonine-4-phosphate dehydrogenase PdxA [Puniceicoccaceae bacterium]
MKAAPLGLACGDPAGVGPELVERWLGERPDDAPAVAVIGPKSWVRKLGDRHAIPTVAVEDPDSAVEPGRPSVEAARVGWAALERVAAGCAAGEFRAAVTAPVGKAWLARAGFPFPGQTEFFASRWGGEPTMAFAAPGLRVILATWHIPLMSLPRHLGPVSLERAVGRAAEFCRRSGVARPRIAVCGLNPHAGEGGLLGTEEVEWIDPCLDRLRQSHPGLSCSLPSDTVFRRHLDGEFDAVVALYHDQGLAPLKALAFHEAAQVTLGLPFLRTSPDHGTAYGLAGSGKADPRSFTAAVALAERLTGTEK